MDVRNQQSPWNAKHSIDSRIQQSLLEGVFFYRPSRIFFRVWIPAFTPKSDASLSLTIRWGLDWKKFPARETWQCWLKRYRHRSWAVSVIWCYKSHLHRQAWAPDSVAASALEDLSWRSLNILDIQLLRHKQLRCNHCWLRNGRRCGCGRGSQRLCQQNLLLRIKQITSNVSTAK